MNEDLIVPSAALPDTRPEEARRRDYKDEEIAGAPAVEAFKHSKILKLLATLFNQWYTSSCVPHGFLTTLEYEGIITPATLKSQLRAYRKRLNYPGEGSIAGDLWDKIKAGVSPLKEAPVKEKMTEAEANALPFVAGTKDLDFNYFEITDYSRIPGYVALGKAIPVYIYATKDEWSREYVKIIDLNLSIGSAYVRHCVCLVPNGDFTEDGVQYLTVHDSAAFGGRQLRYMPLPFLLKRAYYAARIEKKGELPPVPVPPAPSLPRVACKLGDRGDAVRNLQAFLIKKKMLDAAYLTGFYGALTAKAVLWYQLSRWEAFSSTIPELIELKGENWGPQSIGTLE